MLNEVKEKHEKRFIEEFSKDLGEKFKVSVEWGFPTLILQIENKDEDNKIIFSFTINGIERDFTMDTLGYSKNEDGLEIPKKVSIDGKTLTFIVTKALRLYEETFKIEQESNGEDNSSN